MIYTILSGLMRGIIFHLAQIFCNSNMKAHVLSIPQGCLPQLLLPLSPRSLSSEEINSIRTSIENRQRWQTAILRKILPQQNQFKIK